MRPAGTDGVQHGQDDGSERRRHGGGEQGDLGPDAEDMAEDIGVPFHPGAVKFYKEAERDVSADRRGWYCTAGAA